MNKKSLLVGICMVLTAFIGSAQTVERLHFPQGGFSIAPLEGQGWGKSQQVLSMFLPATDSFAANVGVMIQPFAGSIDEYLTASLNQFKEAGFRTIQKKVLGKSALIIEYAGVVHGKGLHWYARAEKSGDKVILATATSTEERWAALADQLKSCVDSFHADTVATH